MNLPPLLFPYDARWEQMIPDEAACTRLWNKRGMLSHIRDHSRAVADVATSIARRAIALGPAFASPALEDMARAAALLHDIAKTYCIQHGGAHAQLGAAWTREDTGNPALAQAVLFHVAWPWEDGDLAPARDPLRLPLIVSYADKRVRHAAIVSLEERFDDLLNRYGDTEEHRASIQHNFDQARQLEHSMTILLGSL